MHWNVYRISAAWTKDVVQLISFYQNKKTLLAITNRFKVSWESDVLDEVAGDIQVEEAEVEKKIGVLIGQFQREIRKTKFGVGADNTSNSNDM